MGVEHVKQHLAKYQLSDSIITLDESSASVEEAAKALHIQPEQVAKSLTFSSEEGCIMVLAIEKYTTENSNAHSTPNPTCSLATKFLHTPTMK